MPGRTARTARTPTALGALALVLASLVAGCAEVEGPDDDLPGVRTETRVDDHYRCGPLLVPQGCPVVRLTNGDSGCAPEAGGYVECSALLRWTATSGAALPGSRLATRVSGEPGPTCEPAPGAPCIVTGSVSYRHDFSGPGQEDAWPVVLEAVLSAPGEPPPATGHFRLAITMVVRTEGPAALAT